MPLKQVVGGIDAVRVEDRIRPLAHERPLAGILGKRADLARVSGRSALLRAGFGRGLAREVEVVQRVARLMEVGALLQELTEQREILVLDAELGRPGLGVDGLVALFLAAEQGHVRSSDQIWSKPGRGSAWTDVGIRASGTCAAGTIEP
jgi:hypothetical protein